MNGGLYVTDASQLDYIQPPRDFLGRDQVPLAGAGADFAGVLPGLGRPYVRLPERPGAALGRPRLVDGAADGFIVKHTIAVGLLAQAAAAMLDARVAGDHLLDR